MRLGVYIFRYICAFIETVFVTQSEIDSASQATANAPNYWLRPFADQTVNATAHARYFAVSCAEIQVRLNI